jgi:hypothetical protein
MKYGLTPYLPGLSNRQALIDSKADWCRVPLLLGSWGAQRDTVRADLWAVKQARPDIEIMATVRVGAYPTDTELYQYRLAAMAMDLAGLADAFQIENEVRSVNFWDDDPNEYPLILALAYEAIKAEDTALKVVAAGMTEREVADTGLGAWLVSLAPYCDGFDMHTSKESPSIITSQVKRLVMQVALHGGGKPVRVSECTGNYLPTAKPTAYQEKTFARNVEDSLKAAATGDAQYVAHFPFADMTSDPSADASGLRYCGLIDGAGKRKPAFETFVKLASAS